MLRSASFVALACVLLATLCVVFPASPARADLLTYFQERSALSAPLSGHIEKVAFASTALRDTRTIYVYTPPGYAASSANYPVLVLLHGTPGGPVDWLYKGEAHTIIDKAIAAKQLPACIAVVVDGHGPYYKGGSEWADSVDGRCRMETALVQDLPKFLKSRYRVSSDPAKWTLAGLSSGGYGAANLVIRHPDVFHNAIVLSGDFEVKDEWGDAQQVFGNDPANRAANSPTQHIRTLSPEARRNLHFYVSIGADDNDELIAENETFVSMCRALGVSVRFDQDKGKHQWGFWSAHFKTGLAMMAGWLGTNS